MATAYLVQTIPDMPLNRDELDHSYTLPYQRTWHPDYDALGRRSRYRRSAVFHRPHPRLFRLVLLLRHHLFAGRASSPREAMNPCLMKQKPSRRCRTSRATSTMWAARRPTSAAPPATSSSKFGTCAGRQCLFPKPCPNMVVDHTDYIKLLREVRSLPKVKKVFRAFRSAL